MHSRTDLITLEAKGKNHQCCEVSKNYSHFKYHFATNLRTEIGERDKGNFHLEVMK
jgi:hypothetical protein